MMKKLKIAQSFGTYFYTKTMPNDYNELDAPIYTLYDENQKVINDFGCYGDMVIYCKTGEYL